MSAELQVLTPVEQWGDVLCKRDDLYWRAGVQGGKVRTCWQLAQGAVGLVTAGSRHSPQVKIVAAVARELGVPAAVHVPAGKLTPEVMYAAEAGAEVLQHRPGHNSVIVARARQDADARGWTLIPFGMECQEAVDLTAEQAQALPWGDFRRLVVAVGSGMTLAGILQGMAGHTPAVPVLGVVVGADPTKRLERWAPMWQWADLWLEPAGVPYEERVLAALQVDVEGTVAAMLVLDPVYEAKAARYLQADDLFWIVGHR